MALRRLLALIFWRNLLSLDLAVGRPPGRRGAKEENKATATQSPFGFFISSPDSKERLRAGNWIIQELLRTQSSKDSNSDFWPPLNM